MSSPGRASRHGEAKHAMPVSAIDNSYLYAMNRERGQSTASQNSRSSKRRGSSPTSSTMGDVGLDMSDDETTGTAPSGSVLSKSPASIQRRAPTGYDVTDSHRRASGRAASFHSRDASRRRPSGSSAASHSQRSPIFSVDADGYAQGFSVSPSRPKQSFDGHDVRSKSDFITAPLSPDDAYTSLPASRPRRKASGESRIRSNSGRAITTQRPISPQVAGGLVEGAQGAQSLSERKRRLASASGNMTILENLPSSAFQDASDNQDVELSYDVMKSGLFGSTQTRERRGDTQRNGTSPVPLPTDVWQPKVEGTGRVAARPPSTEASASKLTLRERIFGSRRLPSSPPEEVAEQGLNSAEQSFEHSAGESTKSETRYLDAANFTPSTSGQTMRMDASPSAGPDEFAHGEDRKFARASESLRSRMAERSANAFVSDENTFKGMEESYTTPEVLDRDRVDSDDDASGASMSSEDWQRGQNLQPGSIRGQERSDEKASHHPSSADDDFVKLSLSGDASKERSISNASRNSANDFPIFVPRTTSLRNVRHVKTDSQSAGYSGSTASNSGVDSPARSRTALSNYYDPAPPTTNPVALDSRSPATTNVTMQSRGVIMETRSPRSSWRNSSSSAAGAAGAEALAAIRSKFGEGSQMQPISPAQLEAIQSQNDLAMAAAPSSSLQAVSDSVGIVPDRNSAHGEIAVRGSVPDSWQRIDMGNDTQALALPKEPVRPRRSPLRAIPPMPTDASRANDQILDGGSRSVSSPLPRSTNISSEDNQSDASLTSQLVQKVRHEIVPQSNGRLAPHNLNAFAQDGNPLLATALSSSDTLPASPNASSTNSHRNDSTASLPVPAEPENIHLPRSSSPVTPRSSAKRALTLRKITPPTLSMPFSKKDKGVKSVTPLVEEEPIEKLSEGWDETLRGNGTVPSRRKANVQKVFAFKKEREERETNRFGRALRQKFEPPIAAPRLQIRRVYDDDTPNESLNDDLSTDSKSAIDSPKLDSGLASAGHSSKSQPQTPSEEFSPQPKLSSRRAHAVLELVDTEASYAADLRVVCDLYLKRATAELRIPASSTTSQSTISDRAMPGSAAQAEPPKSAPPSVLRLEKLSKGSGKESLSAAQAPSSAGRSNRSSVYTTSSQASATDLSSILGQTSTSLPGTPPIGQQGQLAKPIFTGRGPTTPNLAASPSTTSALQSRTASDSRSQLNVTSSLRKISSASGDGSEMKPPLSATDIRIIFAHLEDAAALASSMEKVLRESVGALASADANTNPVDDILGLEFRNFIPWISNVFTRYCSRHEASMQRLHWLLAHSPQAAEFIGECTSEARKRTTAWDLGSLLIKPVQRVLKYPLLLRQILNATDATHPDYKNIRLSFEEMQKVAEQINQTKRRRDLAISLIKDRTRKDVGGQRITSGGKLKKKASHKAIFSAARDETLLMTDGGEDAIEVYLSLAEQYNLLQKRALAFGRRCKAWSVALFNVYNAELAYVFRLRRIYALQLASKEDNQDGSFASQAPSSGEERVVAGYIEILKDILDRIWRQLDGDITSLILPMTHKIEEMFDAPRLVMAMRAEKLPDYEKFRHMLVQEGRVPKKLDRDLADGANAFIALQGQLIDEIPEFIRGVQILLDVGVHAFARLQAAHMDEVRQTILHFWSSQGEHQEEVKLSASARTSGAHDSSTLRLSDSVHRFHAGQQDVLEKLNSLTLTQHGSEEVLAEGDVFHTPTSERIANFDATESSPYVFGDDSRTSSLSNLGSSRYQAANGSSSSILPGLSSRRPSGVAGIMRSISSPFVKETGAKTESTPPMPFSAMSKAQRQADKVDKGDKVVGTSSEQPRNVSEVPPSLPSLVFHEEDRGGFFIQSRPISFLDSHDQAPPKEPLIVSEEDGHPLPFNGTETGPNVQGDKKSGKGHGKSSSQVIRDFYVVVANTDSNEGTDAIEPALANDEAQFHAQQPSSGGTAMTSALSTDSIPPPPADKEPQKHLEWPFVRFVRGDTFKVISSDSTSISGTTLLFGRIDRTGELGWAQQKDFSAAN